MTITTSLGYKANIDKEKVLDFELSYLIGALQNDTPDQQLKDMNLLVDKLLGSRENVMKFFACIRKNNNGLCDQETVSNQILEILNALGNNKKK